MNVKSVYKIKKYCNGISYYCQILIDTGIKLLSCISREKYSLFYHFQSKVKEAKTKNQSKTIK